MKERVLVLTGATGFLGSHLMAALLARGDRLVILGRASGEIGLSERIAKLLDWFGYENSRGQIEPIEVDLLKPFLGLTQHEYHALCAKRGQIIHCASDTRFSEGNRLSSTETNVHGLKEMINFAEDSRSSFFHYVSTAYVAGSTSSLCAEAPVNGDGFANVYEETKARAEKEVAARCTMNGIPYTILRPSIVYGDSRTGRANRFNALYYHVKSLYFIREIYLNDILKQGGRKSREWGIHLDDKGFLHLPLKIFVARRGYVNVIPINYFASAVLSILEKAESGSVYHITSDAPKTTEELASHCESFLRMRGIEIIYGNPSDKESLNPAEALFDRFVEPYRPYLADTRVFERRNTDMASPGLTPPEFTYDIFERCMDYAIKVNWGNGKTSKS
jgi:nucleoside-diphosphate-sugar epimerase